MRVCAFTPYIYNIYNKKNNVKENGENMHKEFHKQLDYIISEMKKEKERNPKSFAFNDDSFKSTKEHNAFSVCRKIILNMPKARLNKLISCSGLNNIPAFSTWRRNTFCSSGYSNSYGDNPGPYTVSRTSFNSIKSSTTLYVRKDFIRFVCAVIGNAASIYPKFRKQVMKKGEGLAIYSSIHHSMNWKGAQKDFYNLLKRSKDNRVKRFLIKNMQAQTLIKFNEKEIQTGNVSFSSDISYVINERLKTYSMNEFDRFLKDGLAEDRTTIRYDWSRSQNVAKCMSALVEDWTPEEKVNKFQLLCDVMDSGLHYGFYHNTASRCLNILISYIPKGKIPFIINRTNKAIGLEERLRWAIEDDENQWSS